MKCEKCGAENPNDSLYCVSCGNKLVSEKKNSKLLLIVLIIVSVIAIGGVATSIVFVIKTNDLNQQITTLQADYDKIKKEYDFTLSESNEMYDALRNVCFVEEGSNTFHAYDCKSHPFSSMNSYYAYNSEKAYELGYEPCEECGTYYKMRHKYFK